MPTSKEAFKARIQIDFTLIIAAVLLLSGLGLLLYQQHREEENNHWVEHTYQVIDQLRAIETLLVDAETGARGYVATGDSVFLEPYRKALPQLSTQLQRLPKRVADNPAQQQQAKVLSRLAKAKVKAVDQLIEHQSDTQSRPLLALGKRRMDAVRRQVARMIDHEQHLLTQRQQKLETTFKITRGLTLLTLALAILALWLAKALIQRELRRRLAAQQNARYSAELLESVIHNIPSGIVLYEAVRNANGQITKLVQTLSNRASHTIRELTQRVGWTSLLTGQDAAVDSAGSFDEVVTVIETGKPLQRLINDPHQQRWFDAQLIKQQDGMLLTYLEVTSLKQAELTQQQQALALAEVNQELRRSNAGLEQFAAIASHDLQEPLRKIQSFGRLLAQQYQQGLNRDGQAMLERLQSAADRMSTLIKELLTYARLSTRQQAFATVSLFDIVRQVQETLELSIQQTGARLAVGSLPTIQGDAIQLSQLFQNLLSNAIKFRQPEELPFIKIDCQLVARADLPNEIVPAQNTARYYQILVSDNGIGFDTQHAERIFQAFQRLHSRQQFEGTGLGLAICQRVVENHGGAITADSKPGQGATFRVYLPA